jgi:hypothetical protein
MQNTAGKGNQSGLQYIVMRIHFLYTILWLTLFACMPVQAEYCKFYPAWPDEMRCGIRIPIAKPESYLRGAILDETFTEYCATDEFDGSEDCIVLMEHTPPLDVELAFHMAAHGAWANYGPWAISITTYDSTKRHFGKAMEIKVDDGSVRICHYSGSAAGIPTPQSKSFRQEYYNIDKELLEAISNATDKVWFRFETGEGTANLKVDASAFRFVDSFIAEASEVLGKE